MAAEKQQYRTVIGRIAEAIRPDDEPGIVDGAEHKAQARGRTLSVRRLFSDVRLMIAMLRDRSFSMSWTARATILAALTYFILPADIVPDYLPVVGFLDDSTVILIVLNRLSSEIARYRLHRTQIAHPYGPDQR